MAQVVGVRFKQACRIYDFDPGGLVLHAGDWVMVESPRGPSLAQVVVPPVVQPNDDEDGPPLAGLKHVLRKAVEDDIQAASDLKRMELEAVEKCGEMAREMNLPIKVVSAEYSPGGNSVAIFFRAEERVDFREIVRRLSASLKTRVELRQAGPRDAAKLLGGIGRCGQTLCCSTFLSELIPVSIKMAKEQDLPLNPTKISGVCGRLLCCLSYEVGDYRAEKAEMAAQKACGAACEAAEGGVRPCARPGETVEGERAVVAAVRTEVGVDAGRGPTGRDEGGPRKRKRPRHRKKKPFGQALPQSVSQPAGGPVPSPSGHGSEPRSVSNPPV